MKPLLRTVITSTISACAGIIGGMWLMSELHEPTDPKINVPCAEDPLTCAERAAASKCGGPGTYKLVGKGSGAGQRHNFDFVCVHMDAV